MNTYGGVDVFLNSALVGGEWSASRPGRSSPREIAPGTHWTGGSVGPRIGMNGMEGRKIIFPNPPSSNPLACRITDCSIPALFTKITHLK
jgi:hypothetical protein